jgi:hypothetical protein
MKKSSLLSQGLIGLSWSILLFFLASYLITESWTWGYRGKWTNLNTYIPVRTSSTLLYDNTQLTKYLHRKRKECLASKN